MLTSITYEIWYAIIRQKSNHFKTDTDIRRRRVAFGCSDLAKFFYSYNQGEADPVLSLEERGIAVDRLLGLKKKGYPILNSSSRLRDMVHNRWRCHDDILINVDPDGSITRGCYVKSRGKINCDACGFTPVAEASGALDLVPGSLWAGWKLFLK